MDIEPLGPERVASLRAARLTYPEVGGTAGDVPHGYRIISRSSRLPIAGDDFGAAVRDLFGWRVQLRAGLRVAASDQRVRPDVVTSRYLRAFDT